MTKNIFSRPILLFFLLAGAFIALRSIPLLTAVGRISHNDELDLGFIAREWLAGPKLPLWHYQMDSYGGESLVLGALCTAAFKFFGPTLFAVKLPPFLFAFATFTLFYFFILRNFGVRKAAAAAVLLILCAPSYVQFSLSGLTGHAETIAFNLAMLFFLYEYLYHGRQSVCIFNFGIFSGLGFWFYHESIVMFLTCVLTWWILDRKTFFSRMQFVLMAGLAVGLIPWLGYNVYYQKQGIYFMMHALNSIGSAGQEALFKKVLRLFLRGVPFSFSVFPVFGIHERVFSIIYCAAACLPVVRPVLSKLHKILLRRKDDEKLLAFVLYPAVFTGIFFLSPFELDYGMSFTGFRYLRPFIFFLIPLPVLCLKSSGFKKVLIGLLAFLGAAGQTSLFFQEPFGLAFREKGYSYYMAGTQWYESLSPSVRTAEGLKNIVAAQQGNGPYFLLWGMAGIGMYKRSDLLLSGSTLKVKDALPYFPASRSYLYEWMGSAYRTLADFKKAAEKIPAENKPYFYKGFYESWFVNATKPVIRCPQCFEGTYADLAAQALGRRTYFRFRSRYLKKTAKSFLGDLSDERIVKLLDRMRQEEIPAEKKPMVFKGFGMAQGWAAEPSNVLLDRPFRRLLELAMPEERKWIYEGLGWALKIMYREDTFRANEGLRNLPEEGRGPAGRGINEFVKWYGLDSLEPPA